MVHTCIWYIISAENENPDFHHDIFVIQTIYFFCFSVSITTQIFHHLHLLIKISTGSIGNSTTHKLVKTPPTHDINLQLGIWI